VEKDRNKAQEPVESEGSQAQALSSRSTSLSLHMFQFT